LTSNRTRLLIYWSIAVGFQVGFAILSAAYPSAFGYSDKFRVFDDVKVYFQDARPILEGRLPYRDYPVEYPILAIPLFVAPMVFGSHFETYKFAFASEMLLLNAWAVWLVARAVEESEGIDRVPGRLAWYSLFFALFCPMSIARFDLAPMLLAFASSRWLAKGQIRAGGVAAGLGVLVKLVPGLVVVPFLAKAGPWGSKAKGLMAFALTVALGGLVWWSLGGEAVASSFRYHGERGLEIGSLYSSAYLIAHKLAGVWVFSHFDHGSMNLSGPGSHDASRLAPIVQGALLVLVAGRARWMASGDEMRFAAAALLAYVLPGKVLSPQYLIWLIPFVCLLPGTIGISARRCFLVCCVLTTALYPHLFHALSYFEPIPVAVLASRNLGLAWLFAILLGQRNFPPIEPKTGLG
jgi:Glycosyltransferase family 87